MLIYTQDMKKETRRDIAGFIFQDKYGVDPRTLTIEEINKKVFQDKKPAMCNKHSRLVSARGSVFKHKQYSDADFLVDRLLC